MGRGKETQHTLHTHFYPCCMGFAFLFFFFFHVMFCGFCFVFGGWGIFVYSIFGLQHSSFPCEILILQVPLKSCDPSGIFLDLPILSSTIPRLFVLTVSRVHWVCHVMSPTRSTPLRPCTYIAFGSSTLRIMCGTKYMLNKYILIWVESDLFQPKIMTFFGFLFLFVCLT